jgi:hypothetical protein
VTIVRITGATRGLGEALESVQADLAPPRSGA